MNKIKHYALGLLGAALLTAGVVACSSEEANTTQSETATTSWNKSADDFKGGPIAQIVNGKATLLNTEADIKSSLLAKGIFTDVESIELVYGYNPETKLQEAFVTVIGKETANAAPLAIIADLTVNGNQLIISNPETNQMAFATFTCRGMTCSYCEYLRTGLFRRITGCKPCIQSSGSCDKVVNGGGSVVKPVSQTLVNPFK